MKFNYKGRVIRFQKGQSGFTMIELLATIGVILVLTAVGFGVYRFVNSGSRAVATESSLMTLLTNAREMKGLSSVYTGISAANLISLDKAPADMISGTGLVNRWGGAVTVSAASFGAGTDNALAITLDKVPTSECSSVISATAQAFQEITVGTTTVKDVPNGVEPTPALLAAGCGGATENLITFTSI